MNKKMKSTLIAVAIGAGIFGSGCSANDNGAGPPEGWKGWDKKVEIEKGNKPTKVTTTTAAVAGDEAAWAIGVSGVASELKVVLADMESEAASADPDPAPLAASCNELSNLVSSARQHTIAPSPSVDKTWQKALDSYEKAAAECSLRTDADGVSGSLPPGVRYLLALGNRSLKEIVADLGDEQVKETVRSLDEHI